MVSEEDVRRVALSLPGVAERSYNRLPGFRARGKPFARLHELPDAILVSCVDIGERDGLVASEPDKFFITAHYRGYPAMLVRLSSIDLAELVELLTESWRLNASARMVAQFDAGEAGAV
jgi:hypothetical protein